MINEKPPRGEQEFWRANTYQLLARLLTGPPSQTLLAQLAEIPLSGKEQGEDVIALAWGELGEAARRADETDLAGEYRALFDEEGGLLIPYASWYMAGERNAKPLNLLRVELAGLGLERLGDVTADHAGALCTTMRVLIESDDPRQIGFFSRHLKPWLPLFFRDLRLARTAEFYRPVGSLGEAFIEVERIFLRETY
ncbi:MAG: molecular chaperone TorD family protein [Proteobacteria bacterium]|nr:molecular chaperone TorD family protein [Pseudomonadota bacterium]